MTNLQRLEDTKTPELLAMHNELASRLGKKPVLKWKQARAKLIGRIKELVEEELRGPEIELEGDTIRAVALQLLCYVAYFEDRMKRPSLDNRVASGHPKARSVGLPYDEIIRRIQVRFPDCETTPECLRWYAVKVRAGEEGYEDMRLPQRRPRVKPKRRN